MKKHITKKFEGRANRRMFLLPGLFLVVLPYAHLIFFLFLAKFTVYHISSYDAGSWVFLLPIPLLSMMLLPIATKRLHDIGWSGWFSVLIISAPIMVAMSALLSFFEMRIIGWLFLYGIYVSPLFILFLLIKKGREGTNKYGKVPVYQKKKTHIFFWILLIILLVAYVTFVDIGIDPSSINYPH